MVSSTRIRGNKLAFIVGGEDYWCDATKVVLDNEEASSDVTTFCDAATGGARQYFFDISAVQSTMVDSFWRYAWANSGQRVPFKYAPHGNEEPTDDEPHFTGFLTVGPRPSIGGEAGVNVSQVFDTRWDVDGTPELVETNGGG